MGCLGQPPIFFTWSALIGPGRRWQHLRSRLARLGLW